MRNSVLIVVALLAGAGCDSTPVCGESAKCLTGGWGGGGAGSGGTGGGGAGGAGGGGAGGGAAGMGGPGAGGGGSGGAGGGGAGMGAGGAGAGGGGTGMPAGNTVIRVHYPAAGVGSMAVRGDGGGLDWMRGAAMQRGADVFEWRGEAAADFDFKPLLDDATWAVGANFRARAGATTEIHPWFHPQGGRQEEQAVSSTVLGGDRTVLVYLPPGYDENATKRYPVLVLQDGHNLYDPARAAFGVEWRVDETLDEGSGTSEIQEVVVLGVVPGDRMVEYTPTMDASYGGGGAALYVRMLTEELLPWARARYRIDADAPAGVGGSSLGGLFTTYACWNHAQVFQRCLAMSSSYWWDGRQLLQEIASSTAMPPIQVWLDSGDSGQSQDGLANTLMMRDVLVGHGYREGVDLFHYTGAGHEHNEAAWAARFPLAMRAIYPGRALGGPQ